MQSGSGAAQQQAHHGRRRAATAGAARPKLAGQGPSLEREHEGELEGSCSSTGLCCVSGMYKNGGHITGAHHRPGHITAVTVTTETRPQKLRSLLWPAPKSSVSLGGTAAITFRVPEADAIWYDWIGWK